MENIFINNRQKSLTTFTSTLKKKFFISSTPGYLVYKKVELLYLQ